MMKIQCRLRVGAVRNLVDDKPDGIIVVGNLQFRRVDTANSLRERPGVVIHQAEQGEVRRGLPPYKIVEFPRPLDVSKEVRQLVIVAAEVRIGSIQQRSMRGEGNLGPCRVGVLYRWNAARCGLQSITYSIAVETVIAHGETGANHRVP